MLRCSTYCTAAGFNIGSLFLALKSAEDTVHLFRDVVHKQIKVDTKTKQEIFYFPYGVVVFWGLSETEEKEILLSLKEFERESIIDPEFDAFTFSYGSATQIAEDEIKLQNKSILTKLAVSHGLAQSVKLNIFEAMVQKTIDKTRILPQNLSKLGKISMSRKEISKKIGELFIERNFINLHADILDVPEFFWDHPELEPFYRRTAHYLDISKRAESLNKRLGVIHDLFEMLSGELNHQHSSRLEWTIIILIVIEVVIALLKDIFHLL